MDVDQDLIKKQCYAFQEQLLDNVHIIKNKLNNFVIFWNKYQMFLYEETHFQKPAKVIIPDYPIQCLLVSNNYLVSLDCNQNVHITSLKFKKTSQKCFKSANQPRDTGVKAIVQLSTDYVVSLKIEEDSHNLNVYKLNQEFSLVKRIILLCKQPNKSPTQTEHCIMCSYPIKKDHLQKLQKALNIEASSQNDSLIIISFDSRNLYACLFGENMTGEEVTLVNLYSCPSDISNIEIVDTDDLQIFIGLTIGTIIKLTFEDLSKKPDVIHLNTGLSKFVIYNDNILYTDSQTMWKVKNIHSDIKFKQFFIRNVKDFINLEDMIICTTFSKLFYTFSILDEESFLKSQCEDYCPAEIVLSDSECLQQIMENVNKSEQLAKRINTEETYLTALALANQQHLIEDILLCKVVPYDSYIVAIKENADLILVEHLPNYFARDMRIFLINITLSVIQHKLNKLVQSIFDNSRLLITLSCEDKIIKSASIKMDRSNHNLKCLIPVEDFGCSVNVGLTIVTDIPGIYDEKKNIVTVLYKKDLIVNPKQCIETL